MFARSLTTNDEIAGGNFEIRQTSIIPCGGRQRLLVVHQQTDGTPRMLLLMPQPKEFSRIPPSCRSALAQTETPGSGLDMLSAMSR